MLNELLATVSGEHQQATELKHLYLLGGSASGARAIGSDAEATLESGSLGSKAPSGA